MTGPDRGRKEDSVAGVLNYIRRILLAVNAHRDINVIFDKNSETLRQEYLNEYCKDKNMRPSSIRKYLQSLKDFAKFLKGTEVEFVNQSLVKTAITNIKLWRKNYSRQARKEANHQRQKKYEMLVTADQVSQYMRRKVIRLYKTLESNSEYELSHTEFCVVRDHLFVILHFSNGCRSGVTVNMTMGEFQRAKHFPERNGWHF